MIWKPPGTSYTTRNRINQKPGEWTMYAFDTRERRRRGIGHRTLEWIATATTEAGVVREMARCLREIAEGRWPT